MPQPDGLLFLSVTNITKFERLHRSASRAISGCLSFFPIPLLLSEASLPPLWVTLIHFSLSSYEWALHLPTSFSISDLAKLGVKSRLCRSPWRGFALTHPLMLPFTSPREAFLVCTPSPPRYLPSFTVDSTLFSPCSRSDLPSLAKVRLSLILTLPLYDLVFCTDGFLPFSLAKAALAYLPTALSVALRLLFPFRHVQYAQVFPLKSAPFYMLSPGLCNKPVISLFSSFYLTHTLSSPPSFLLSQSLWQIWQELLSLSSCSIRLQCVHGHWFLPGNDVADELARREVLLVPSAIPWSLSVISCFYSSLFSDWRRTVSCKFFNAQVSSVSTEELVLPRPARSTPSRLRCNGHSHLLSSYLSKIGRIENPSCSACGHPSKDTSHLFLHSPATDSLRRSLFGESLSLYDLWSRPWVVALLLGLHGLPPRPHPSEGVR